MRRLPLIVLLIVGTMAAATAACVAAAPSGEGSVTVKVSDGLPIVSVGFSPKALSRTDRTPVSLLLAGEIQEDDGSSPPALRELALEFDRSIEFHVAGVPVCRKSQLRGTETREALRACGPASIGEGTASVQIASAAPSDLHPPPKALIFNGGEVGDRVTLLVHLYLPSPVSKAIVMPVKITRHPDGRFGTSAVARFPRIAGGAGRVTRFDLEIDREVVSGGDAFHPVRAGCRDGKLKVHSEARFEDGTRTNEEVVRACTPVG